MTMMERNKFYMKMKDHNLAYIAGLFDGEGSIHIKRAPEKKKKHQGKPGYRMSKKPRKGRRVDGTKYLMQYRWRCTFRDAFYVCCLLFPYAHTKLAKIQQVINHYTHGDHKIMNEKVVNLQDYKELMSLE